MRNSDLVTAGISLSELFDSVAGKITSKLSEKNLRLDIDCEQGSITGDRVLLESLIINLLDNAIKASIPGTFVQLSGIAENDRCVISIKDSGKGMPEEHIAKLTEPFYRVDKSRNRSDGGAGLGLALCKQIADLHEAQLVFSSEEGKGTLVKIIMK